jgi:trimeric autotransporter adhesin
MALHVCVRGIGIRRSKDLRAEIRKFLNSTNERKNMSTKTLRKRIALVAVSTLGAGVLSVAPAHATDAIFVTAGVGVNGTAIVAAAGTGTSQTVTIGVNSSVSITAVAGTDAEAAFTVSGGTISGASVPTDAASGLSTPTTFVYGNTTARVTFTPNAGESRMVITSWLDTAKRTAGTPKAAEIVVTIKTGAVGVVSPADSFVSVVAAATTADPSNNVDVAAARSVAIGTNGRVNFLLKDANGVELASTAVVTTSASAGCLVGSTDSASAFLSASVSTVYGTADEVFVARAATGVPATCTLTMSVNGVALGTKTITLQGKITKVEVDGGQAGILNAFASNSTSESVFSYSAYDAAGNAATGLTISNTSTASAAFSSVTTTDTTDPVNGAYGDVTCSGAARGSGTFFLSYVNTSGETIKSPTYTVNCFGNAVTYTASLDKASYVPGDIATLTITAKDASGNPANDYVYLGGTSTGTGTTLAPSIAGSNMTAITAPTSTDLFSAGKKTYKFVVGSTEGSYQLAIDLPKFNSTTYSQSAITVAYKIAASSATVSNADVLKAIVSLIASINKQIAALQKALLRR